MVASEHFRGTGTDTIITANAYKIATRGYNPVARHGIEQYRQALLFLLMDSCFMLHLERQDGGIWRKDRKGPRQDLLVSRSLRVRPQNEYVGEDPGTGEAAAARGRPKRQL